MARLPFEKINVSLICEGCGMNRKSFYYHFRDKYELVNWIFDSEFISLVAEEDAEAERPLPLELVSSACNYFYANRDFYRNALQIKGQNSFSEHFREFVRLVLKQRLSLLLGPESADDFTLDFFSDAALCAIERWLLDKDCMPPEEFVERLRRLLLNSAEAISGERRLTQEEKSE